MIVDKSGPKRLSWNSLGLTRPVPPGLWPVGTPMPPLCRLLKELAQERHWQHDEELVATLTESLK